MHKKRKGVNEMEPGKFTNTITPNDVLLGRGGNTFRHIGNRQFREQARVHAPRYSQSTKLEKSQISRTLMMSVKQMNPPGRFLKKENHCWVEVDEYVAREKASQCLRDAVSSLQKVEEKVGVLPESTSKRHTGHGKRKSKTKKGSSLLLPGEDLEKDRAKSSRVPLKGRSTFLRGGFQEEVSTDTKPSTLQAHHVLHRGHRMNNQMYQSSDYAVPGSSDYAVPGSIDTFQEFNHRSFYPVQAPYRSDAGDDQQQAGAAYSTHAAPYFPSSHTATIPSGNYPSSAAPGPLQAAYSSARLQDNIQMTPIRPYEAADGGSQLHQNFKNYYDFQYSNSFEQQQNFEEPRVQIPRPSSSPENLHLASFFSPQREGDINNQESSPTISPDRKRLKPRSSDDTPYDLSFGAMQSTSHSVDSIDSFSKSL